MNSETPPRRGARRDCVSFLYHRIRIEGREWDAPSWPDFFPTNENAPPGTGRGVREKPPVEGTEGMGLEVAPADRSTRAGRVRRTPPGRVVGGVRWSTGPR